MARSYKRDGNGRFAGGGGSSGGGGKGGGSKAKGGGAKPKAAAKPAAPKAAPKTTTARGRAKTNEQRASAALKQANKSGLAARKEAKSQLVAQRARDFYKRSGTGTKRSATKASGGSKPAKAVMAKGTVAQRKAAMNKQVTGAMLLGKGPRNAQRERYVGAQNRTAVQAAASAKGKGSKAARRIANAKKKR